MPSSRSIFCAKWAPHAVLPVGIVTALVFYIVNDLLGMTHPLLIQFWLRVPGLGACLGGCLIGYQSLFMVRYPTVAAEHDVNLPGRTPTPDTDSEARKRGIKSILVSIVLFLVGLLWLAMPLMMWQLISS